MQGIQWSKDFEIGVAILDEQHKSLLGNMQRLDDLVRQRSPRVEIESALEALTTDSRAHFATERQLIEVFNVPESLDSARVSAGHLINDVVNLRSVCNRTSRHLDPRVMSHLKQWLPRHIEEDRRLAAYLNSSAAVVNVINQMILSAHELGVSDIHIDAHAGKEGSRVRFRKDGTLFDYMKIPVESRSALVSRIKVMADLDISERRKPQDGRLDFSKFGAADVELRVATIPTASGMENVVMRLLSTGRLIPMNGLGLAPGILGSVREIAAKPYGLFLVCGPTGSGKTTTLHSILADINTPERKIWTAEDPIEITQSGLCQVQVNPRIGWTFASAMRSLLRGDPDVIMVGEMRDAETAKIAVEASLTGHLVFSTLHTNSAPESIVRLLDLGMDRFNFSDALLGVLAQRLSKQLCSSCKKAYVAGEEEIGELLREYCAGTALDQTAIAAQWKAQWGDKKGHFKLYRACGCDQCNHTGYAGRIALHEMLNASAGIKRLIQTGASIEDIRAQGVAEGMRTLKQSGIGRVLEGLTDIAKVRAVCA